MKGRLPAETLGVVHKMIAKSTDATERVPPSDGKESISL